MSDERELKLRCLQVAGGDITKAQAMFEWLTSGPSEREKDMFDRGVRYGKMAYRILSQAVETDQPEVPEVEETLPGDPLPGFDEADAESDDYEIVMGEPRPEASSQSAKAEPFTLPGGVEESRDQFDVAAAFNDFMRLPGAVKVTSGEFVEITRKPAEWLYSDGVIIAGADPCIIHEHGPLIAYRVLEPTQETPNPITGQDEADPASDALGDDGEVVTFTDAGIELTPDSVVTIVANEPPTQSLWLQGYNDKQNGFDPALSEPDYLKGYEARAEIEKEMAGLTGGYQHVIRETENA